MMRRKLAAIIIFSFAALFVLCMTACAKTDTSGAETPETVTAESEPTADLEPTAEPEKREAEPKQTLTMEQLLEKNGVAEILKTHENIHIVTDWSSGSDSSYTSDSIFLKTEGGIMKIDSVSFSAANRDSSRTVTQYGSDPFTVFLSVDPDETSLYLTPKKQVETEPDMCLVDGGAEMYAGMTELEIVNRSETADGDLVTLIGKDPDNGEEMFEADYVVDHETGMILRGESRNYMGDDWMGTKTVTVTLDETGIVQPKDPCLQDEEGTVYSVTLHVQYADGTKEEQSYRVKDGTVLYYEDFMDYTIYQDAEMSKQYLPNPEFDSGISSYLGPVNSDLSVYVLQKGYE